MHSGQWEKECFGISGGKNALVSLVSEKILAVSGRKNALVLVIRKKY